MTSPFNEEAARRSPMWQPADSPQRPLMGFGPALEIDKNGLAQLYDTVDKTFWKGWLSTADEILRHPQQFGPDGPRFITLGEKRRRDEQELERQREDRIRVEVTNTYELGDARKALEEKIRAEVRAELMAEQSAKTPSTAQSAAAPSAPSAAPGPAAKPTPTAAPRPTPKA